MIRPVAGTPVTSVRDRFEEALDRLAISPGRVLVAVSGGPDSIALLDLLAEVAPNRGFDLRVVHFDHGIHPASADIGERVRGLAERYRLPADFGGASLGPTASETLARRGRLQWFRELLDQYQPAVLATGHQADDQVETLLMRFLKGSGPAGLAGIAERQGDFVRPLLRVWRAELAAHVDRIGIKSWSDPANLDPRHLRSWLRHEVLPPIESRLPNLRQDLLAARGVFEDERQAWDALAKELPLLDFRSEPRAISVAASSLSGYSSAVVRPLLKALGRRASVGLGERAVDRLQDLLAHGDTGQSVDLVSGTRAEVSFGRLRLFVSPEHPTSGLMIDSVAGSATLGDWVVDWDSDAAPERLDRVGFRTWVDATGPVQVRAWRPGDQVRPIRGRGARLVVRCMQEAKVPRSRRPDWPVVEHRGKVVWVPGVCRSEALVPAPGTLARRIDVRPSRDAPPDRRSRR